MLFEQPLEGETELDIVQLGRDSYGVIDDFARKHTGVEILMESGRYLVAESGAYIAKVLYTKSSQGINFAVTNGGTHHHAAAGGSGNAFMKNFPIRGFVAEASDYDFYHLSGPLCTPNDLIGKKVFLPKLKPGDYIAVMKSGAYGLTTSPVLFLSHPLPREVLIDGETVTLIRENTEYVVPKLRGGSFPLS